MIFQRLPVALAILLAALLAGAIYWQLQPVLEPGSRPVIPPPTPQATTRNNTRDHNIASFQLFGNATQPEIVAPVQKTLPVTKLRLTLTGVVASASETTASALIEGPDRETQYYKVGDQLPGNATLKQVYADRVIVDRAGQLENLYFPEVASVGLSRNNNNLPDYSTPAYSPPKVPVRHSNADSNSIANARKQSIKDRLSKLRKRIINKNN